MAIYTSVLTAGTNSHQETSENINGLATDFVSQGVIGAITNTSGVAPSTGAFAVNAQGTPNMTVAVSSGVAYVTATPSSQDSQNLRVRNTASTNVTISANTSGSTKYDWLYIKIDATKAANPAADASDVATLVTSRSSSSTTDNGTPPTYGYCIAVITVANNASSIANGNIADERALSKTTPTNTVPASALATNAITLGYAQITSNFTGSGFALQQVTGLSVTVTIPAGNRRIKITAFGDSMSAGSTPYITLWDGTVGSGTQLAQTTFGNTNGFVIMASGTPPAGTKTYNVGIFSTSGTVSIAAGATYPAFILVEAI